MAVIPVDISVIVPAHNAGDVLRKVLQPLRRCVDEGLVKEVVVVDDGSTDDSIRLARELGFPVISTGGRRGVAVARNLGAATASGSVLWFIDADVVVHEDAARVLTECLITTGAASVIGSYDDRPAAGNFLSQYKNLIHHYHHQHAKREASHFWAGCGAVRAESFAAVGGFDERRFKLPSVEDIDLGYRLRDAGYRIVLEPRLLAAHMKEWRLGGLLYTEIFRRAVPWARLVLERGHIDDDYNLSWIERARASLAIATFTITGLCLFAGLSWWLLMAMGLFVAIANRGLWVFFSRLRDRWFALMGVGFHQFYYLYSTGAFVWTWLTHRRGKVLRSQ